MIADLKGSLKQLDKSYKMFTHKGKHLTKEQVKKILEYGIERGYTDSGQLSEEEIDKILITEISQENETLCAYQETLQFVKSKLKK